MNLFNSLGTLESAGLIQVSKVEPDLEYLFRHSMVQDAAYASLLESDRKRLHRAVGDAIEKLYPERKKELAAVLGYHFKEAGEDDRALDYFIIAGDEALATYANQEAEVQYRSALGLVCCTVPQIAHLYSMLGEALYRQNRFAESSESFRNANDVYLSLKDFNGLAKSYSRLSRVEWYAGDRPEGLRICLEGLEEVKDAPDSLGKATLIHETARAYYFNGNSEKALPLCRQALQLAEQLGDKYLQADSLATLGIIAGIDPDESLDALRKAIDLAEANSYYQVAVRAHINLGTMERTWNGDNDISLVHFKRSAEIGKMRGVVAEELLGLTSYVSCLFSPGRLKEIEAEMPHVVALVKQLPNPDPMWAHIDFMNAVILYYRGEWDKALPIYRKCLQIFREQENMESILNMLNEIAWLLLEKQRWGESVDLGEVDAYSVEALKLVDEKNLTERIWVYPGITILKARQGKLQEAEQWIEKLHGRLATRHSIWDERFYYECLSEVAFARKDWDTAIQNIEKVVDMEQKLGFMAHHARNLLCWGDFLINRGSPGDLEKAQTILRQSIDEFTQMGIGYYPAQAQDRLKLIQRRMYAQTIDLNKMTRELKKARQVQESLLPENLPKIPGWDLTVMLEPAHETSGDFYDFLTLPDRDLGMVIADVTDKGTSAALYMALSRALWRTFAVNHPGEPERTMADTNQRILSDTHGGLYITLFYAILNPKDGEFTYSSAGHLPGLVLRAKDGSVEELERTGMPLGVMEETKWSQVRVEIAPGDTLLLYTDGITEAQNQDEEFFGMERLKEVFSSQMGKPAAEVRDAVRGAVRDFVGPAEQFDDMTMLVVVREKDK